MKIVSFSIDQLIDHRKEARDKKDWKLSDEIRDYLDDKLIFIFDTKEGQEIWYLTNDYFKFQYKHPEINSKRKYLEFRIKQDILAEKHFDAWLYSMRSSAGLI